MDKMGGKEEKYFFDLHRHDEFSFFDGFGKAKDLAKHAKELGYSALGISNHGNISGLVRHWKACKDVGIKPILGCEVYFQPFFNEDEPNKKSYHLCLFAKNYEGYKNLCHILTIANTEQFYYKPIVSFRLLKKYGEGLICTTACIAGYLSSALKTGNEKKAKKFLKEMQNIFDDDLYVEIQPYKIDDNGTQEKVNIALVTIAEECDVRCILTSDSHYGKQEEFETYCKMHEIAKHDLVWVKDTYSERYMPSGEDIRERFIKMHEKDFSSVNALSYSMFENLKKLQDSVEEDIFEKCELKFPKISENVDSRRVLIDMTKKGLKKRGKYKKEYISRCIKELNVINFHQFNDYFLIVQEYVNWARKKGIAVGDGRGSACNCLVSYAIGITDVDSIKYNLDFSRFMRKEKKKTPDIDVDFETSRRNEVIAHVIETYKGKSVQICSYSEYDISGLINDLAKICGLPTDGECDSYDREMNRNTIADIKRYIMAYENEGVLDIDLLKQDMKYEEYNNRYDNIILHFCLLYKKVRNLGTHAAGVAVTGGNIEEYTCIVRRSSGKNVYYSSCYDLNDLEAINCLKFDMLGLKTLSELKEFEEKTGYKVKEEDLDDGRLYEAFRNGETDGIFQMEKTAPKKILNMIRCDNIGDVIAVNALNRPAPLQLKMHETFAHNKLSGNVDTNTPYYKYTKETYGTILYQEQTVDVAQRLGHLSAEQSFDLLKIMKKPENLTKQEYIPVIEKMKKDFFKGCKSEGITLEETKEIWSSLLIYGFNKGHSTGYSLISVKQMYYKIHYPTVFWYVKMKYARNDADFYKFTRLAIKGGVVVFLPHVNYSAFTSLGKESGEHVIRQGLNTVKGIGDKAAVTIEEERKENGFFKSYEDFVERCKGRRVNTRTINLLGECGALDFKKEKYLNRVIAYNSTMAVRR